MKIAKPFTVEFIEEVVARPIMNARMPFSKQRVLGMFIGKQGSDDGFVVGPPKLHVMPIFLDRFSFDIDEIEQPTMFWIPTSFEHPSHHIQTGLNP